LISTNTSPSRHWLIAILVATLLARAGFLLFFADTLSLQTSGYDDYAVHLLEGRGYTRFDDRSGDSDLPPLYPFFLAGTYALLGRHPVSVACIQIVFDLLTTLLLYLIGRRFANETTGLLSAAFYGCYPYLLFQNLTVNDTAIFICLLVAAIWLTYRVRDSKRACHAIALGLVVGGAALTKTLVVLILPLLIMSWRRTLGSRRTIRFALLSALSVAAVVSPWVIRNTLLHGELVFISTNGGSNLHQGNNPCVADYLARGWDAQWVRCLAAPPPGLSEVDEDRWHRNEAIRYLWDHPRSWPRLLATKFSVLWNPAIRPSGLPPDVKAVGGAVLLYETPAFRAARIVNLIYFGPLLVFGLIGLVWGRRDRLPIGPLVAVPLVITLFYMVFHPSTRYRSPADPFLFVLAAYGLSRIWERSTRNCTEPRTARGC
jgi:4-amino-4-deoxy-L-arabinose transferase-like glycosyltransferase